MQKSVQFKQFKTINFSSNKNSGTILRFVFLNSRFELTETLTNYNSLTAEKDQAERYSQAEYFIANASDKQFRD